MMIVSNVVNKNVFIQTYQVNQPKYLQLWPQRGQGPTGIDEEELTNFSKAKYSFALCSIIHNSAHVADFNPRTNPGVVDRDRF